MQHVVAKALHELGDWGTQKRRGDPLFVCHRSVCLGVMLPHEPSGVVYERDGRRGEIVDVPAKLALRLPVRVAIFFKHQGEALVWVSDALGRIDQLHRIHSEHVERCAALGIAAQIRRTRTFLKSGAKAQRWCWVRSCVRASAKIAARVHSENRTLYDL